MGEPGRGDSPTAEIGRLRLERAAGDVASGHPIRAPEVPESRRYSAVFRPVVSCPIGMVPTLLGTWSTLVSTDNWPNLEYRTLEDAIETIGQIQPFRPACDAKTLDYQLCGLPVKLRWHYADVSGVLAESRADAAKLFDALGPQ